jgi:molybdate transport system ATP-binding protein
LELNIKKSLGEFELALDFCTDCKRIGILGASGSGKSLTLKCLAGIEKPDSGHIAISGRELYNSQKRLNLKPQKRRVGYLFQSYALFPTMTVEQNIACAMRGNRAEKAMRVADMIKRFRLDGLQKRLPGELSGGQQQRVALARILAYEPEVILLDEPFSALDVHLRDELKDELLLMLKDYDGTVVLVSHSPNELYSMTDEMLVLENGKRVACGKTKSLFENPPNSATARLVGFSNISTVEMRGNTAYLTDYALSVPCDRAASFAAVHSWDFTTDRVSIDDIEIPLVDPVFTEDILSLKIRFLSDENAPKRLVCELPKQNDLPDRVYLNRDKVRLLEE